MAQRGNAAEIEAWLSARISALLGVGEHEISVERPFSTFGVDSLQAVGLAGDLEEWLNRDLPETLLWDYPTIATLSEYLAASLAAVEQGGGDV